MSSTQLMDRQNHLQAMVGAVGDGGETKSTMIRRHQMVASTYIVRAKKHTCSFALFNTSSQVSTFQMKFKTNVTKDWSEII